MCINAGYFEKKLGETITVFWKIVQGFLLMVFVLVLLVGPILLFSQINPVGQTNFVNSGVMRFSINLRNTTVNAEANIDLFATTQLTQVT
jgi:hypothetical protein